MLQATETKETELENQVLHQFGALFYCTEDQVEINWRFRLTRTVLNDILHECATEPKPENCRERLLDKNSEAYNFLTGEDRKGLVRFTATARYGRCVFKQAGLDPELFVSNETLIFARKAHWYLDRVTNPI